MSVVSAHLPWRNVASSGSTCQHCACRANEATSTPPPSQSQIHPTFSRIRTAMHPFLTRAMEPIRGVIPVSIYCIILQYFLLQRWTLTSTIVISIFSAIIGIIMYREGIELAIMPLSEAVGRELFRPGPGFRHPLLILFLVGGLGVVATYAEPSLESLDTLAQFLRPQDNPIVPYLLIKWRIPLVFCIALGVGIAATLGTCRYYKGWSLTPMLLGSIGLAFILTITLRMSTRGVLQPLMSFSWDCGALSVGPVTIPIMLAVGIGASRAMAERMELEAEQALASGGDIDTYNSDAARRKRMKKRQSASHQLSGLGVVAMSSAWPVITVLLLSIVLDLTVPEEEIIRFTASLPEQLGDLQNEATPNSMLPMLGSSVRSTFPLVLYLLIMAKLVLRIDIPTTNSLKELAPAAMQMSEETFPPHESNSPTVEIVKCNGFSHQDRQSATNPPFTATPIGSPMRTSTPSPRLGIRPPSPRLTEFDFSELHTDSRIETAGWKLVSSGRSPKSSNSISNNIDSWDSKAESFPEHLTSTTSGGGISSKIDDKFLAPSTGNRTHRKRNSYDDIEPDASKLRVDESRGSLVRHRSLSDMRSRSLTPIFTCGKDLAGETTDLTPSRPRSIFGDFSILGDDGQIVAFVHSRSPSPRPVARDSLPSRTEFNPNDTFSCNIEVQIVISPATESGACNSTSGREASFGVDHSQIVATNMCRSCWFRTGWSRIRRSWFISELEQKWFYPVGVLLCTLGLTLFDFGVTYGFGPMGNQLGTALPALYVATISDTTGEHLRGPFFSRTNGIVFCLFLLFVLGALAALAEPGLAVLGQAVEFVTHNRMKSWVIVVATGVGVGLGLSMGVGKQLSTLFLGYPVYWVLTAFAPVIAFTFLYAFVTPETVKVLSHRLVKLCRKNPGEQQQQTTSLEVVSIERICDDGVKGAGSVPSVPSGDSSGTLVSDVNPNAPIESGENDVETPEVHEAAISTIPEDEELATENVVAASWDAGVVALGPVITPFIIALGSGVAKVTPDTVTIGTPFGALAICSAVPVLVILVSFMGQRAWNALKKWATGIRNHKRSSMDAAGSNLGISSLSNA
ncbi:hypothetical protein HK102_001414 [Quaeritorhiza haematococci]|nr:hypothetical protein HK102_001414 [Quaeritorhiza haematococci]